jgi:hypothetical protein
LILESEDHLKLPGGQEYEAKAIKAVGQLMANFMRDCTSYLSSDELPPFHLFIRINSDGTTSGLEVYPTNALSVCFKGLMSDVIFPPHTYRSFLLDIETKVTDQSSISRRITRLIQSTQKTALPLSSALCFFHKSVSSCNLI